MKIGFFDSGIGGITVLSHALQVLPNETYLYYADIKNVPYGTKTKGEVEKLTISAISFLVKLGAEIVVIACNTATSVAVNSLRKKFNIPIIGMEPAVKPAINLPEEGKVLVFATDLTLREAKMNELIKNLHGDDIIDKLPLPGLVTFSEEGIFDSEEVINYLQEVFAPYNFDEYKAIVLGCTHFCYYREIMRKILPSHIKIIDGAEGTINRLSSFIVKSGDTGGSIKFYLSGEPATPDDEKK
jgi:glutamate racemase